MQAHNAHLDHQVFLLAANLTSDLRHVISWQLHLDAFYWLLCDRSMAPTMTMMSRDFCLTNDREVAGRQADAYYRPLLMLARQRGVCILVIPLL